MIIFTNNELGVSDKTYFLNKNKKIYLREKDITLEEMKMYWKDMLQEGASKEDLLYFVDDRASSIISGDKLEELDTYLKILLQEVDVFYLANFMDNCRVIRPISSYIPEDFQHIKFYHSLSPNGFYATVSTFEKWEQIFEKLETRKESKIASRMSNLVQEKEISAGTTWPRIFVPDINKLSNDMDNFYTYPCRIEKNFVNSEKKEIEELSMFWFVLGVSLVFLFFLLITKVFPYRKMMEIYQ